MPEDAPFLSVVVPAYDVEAYVRQCLMSVLEQPDVDLEVIVVNDCATDHTRSITAEVAALDPRVRIIDNPRNMGLGPSRNAGLDAARGEYVMFLDSDDYVLERTLAPLVEAARVHRPDLVLYDYERVTWDDQRVRNARGHALRGAPRPIVLSDRPELLRVLNVAWNKLYRRDFLLGTGLRFPVGYYEDIPFTYPILGLARSILLVDEVVVAYRQRRAGSILRSRDDRHAEVLAQAVRTCAEVESRTELTDWAGPIFVRCAAHVLRVVDGDRLPTGSRAALFHSASEQLRAHVPDGLTMPPGAAGTKLRLLLADRYLTYRLLRTANAGRVRGRRLYARLRARVRPGRLKVLARRAAYAVASRRRVDPNLTVLYSLWGRVPTGNPLAIEQELLRRRPDMRTVWLVRARDIGRLPPGTRAVAPGGRAAQSLMARAGYLVSDVNFPDHVRPRRGQVVLQTQHGTPLKFMGLDMQRFPAAALDFEKLLSRVDAWTYNLSSNSYSTEIWRRAFPARYRMLEYGYPRNDRLVRAGEADTVAARAALGLPDDHVVVLYAPTHRDDRTGFRPDLDIAALADGLPARTTILVRGHYFYAGRTRGLDEDRVVDVSENPHIEDLYLAADVLVTDYSSAMFDFANLGRPIIIHAPDWEHYRNTRGTYFDITAEPPGIVTRTVADLVAAVRDGRHADEHSRALLEEFRRRFCAFDDGHAAERVVRTVFLGEDVDPPAPVHGSPAPLRTWVTDRAG